MFGKKKNEDYSVKTVKVGVDKLTTIALGTMVKGTITVEGDLRLDGIIEGNVSCRGKLEIESKARFNGTCNTTEKDTLVTSQVVKPETVDTEK